MKVQCQICGKYFTRITNTHLMSHEMTEKEYRKKYGALSGKEVLQGVKSFEAKELLPAILKDPDSDTFNALVQGTRARDLRLFSEEGRAAVIQSQYVLLTSALQSMLKSSEVSSKVLEDLNEYISTGIGPDGNPLDVKELVKAGEFAQRIVAESSRAITALGNTVTRENATIMSRPSPVVEVAFSGEENKTPAIVPESREKMRVLIDALMKKAAEEGIESVQKQLQDGESDVEKVPSKEEK